MNKEAILQEVYERSFKDELEKCAVKASDIQNIVNKVKKHKLIRRAVQIDPSNPKNKKLIKVKGVLNPVKGFTSNRPTLQLGAVPSVISDRYKGKVFAQKGVTLKDISKEIHSPFNGDLTRIKNKSLRNLSKKDTKLFNQIGLVHEMQESKITPKNIIGFSSHASPKVLLDEHNLITALGNRKVRDAMYNIRGITGEGLGLKNLVGKDFRYGVSGKVPKAMKKHIIRKLEVEIGVSRKDIINQTKQLNKIPG